jgi:SAM-dependent methyltransferase
MLNKLKNQIIKYYLIGFIMRFFIVFILTCSFLRAADITTTCPLRYPHLLLDLLAIKKHEDFSKKDILIAGLGEFYGSCPFLHEMSAFFSEQRITAIDINPLVLKTAKHSHYYYDLAQKIRIEFSWELNRAHIALYSDKENIQDLILLKNIHAKRIFGLKEIVQAIKDKSISPRILEQDFSKALLPNSFDFIFSPNSLIYAISDWTGKSQDKACIKPNALDIVKNFLNALKPGGRLYIEPWAFRIFAELIPIRVEDNKFKLDNSYYLFREIPKLLSSFVVPRAIIEPENPGRIKSSGIFCIQKLSN